MMNEEAKSLFDYPFAVAFRFVGDKSCSAILLVLTLALAFLAILPGSVYIREYPQDIFGFLDGIHRMASGQVPHRDFSSVLGILVYALPSLFVRFNADPVLSLAYSQAALLILNFIVLVYLVRMRIPGIPGLFFGIWTLLVLAARMNFGEWPQNVTFAMFYNRYCTVFLSEIIIFFIPPKSDNTKILIIDVVVISVLTLIMFYSKMTFFSVAAAALALLSLTSRRNAIRVIAVTSICLIVMAGLEVAYRFHRGYFLDLMMALRSSGAVRGGYTGTLFLILMNLPELVLCAGLPLLIIYRLGVLTVLTSLIFVFVAGASVLLIEQNAQNYILAVPFILLFLSSDIIDRRAQPSSRQAASRNVISSAIILMWFVYSYPLAVNSVVSFAKSISGAKPINTENSTKRFQIDWRSADPQLSQDIVTTAGSPLDLFERARESTTNIPGMPLSEAEYALSLDDGFKAARGGCGVSARILTADVVNPFPAALDLPVGGRMIHIAPDRTISIVSHPSPDQMFRDITCVMFPKMPISYSARQMFSKIYSAYLEKNFKVRRETDYWTVYTVNTASGPEIPGATTSQ
jgi:hypothetical protein